MKKLFILVAVAGLAVGATSCKKERDCTCDNTVTEKKETISIPKGKKGDQKTACEALSSNSLSFYKNCKLD